MPGSCVAFGCSMRKGTNLLSEVKLFRFPKNPERRLLWEQAVRRENWKSTSNSSLCNLHFITGKPSSDPLHPDYVPSVFSYGKTKQPSGSCSVSRYDRHSKRMKTDASHSSDVLMDPMDIPDEPEESGESIHLPETKECSTMTDLSLADILKMEKLNEAYKVQNNNLAKSLEASSCAKKIINTSKLLNFYTKITNATIFYGLLSYVLDSWKPTTKTNLENDEQLLMVLMKLRLGLLNEDLAYRFSVGAGTVSQVFREWVTRMAFVLKKFIFQPSQKTIAANLPPSFRVTTLRKVSCILDCSEIFINRPFNLDARAKTYSNYKHHNTVKFLISCTPSGGISFVSKLYGGRISDKEITKMSGFVETVKQGDVILADRGFRIDEMLALKNATVIVPASTKGKKQLTGAEVANTRVVARVRIHIERCIGRIKAYGILKSTWPITYLSHSGDGKTCTGDNILIVIAALCNLTRPKIV